LHIDELERSLKFYIDVLGFETRHVSTGPGPKRAFLRCGIQGLDLFETDSGSHGGEEMNHMALCVAADEIDEVVVALNAAGITTSPRTERNSVFIHDPDGHRIEMLPLSAHERSGEREAARASA
jgi:catechol 2,3-dioxygenase-like lactoylglutathione lyase family enzyme